MNFLTKQVVCLTIVALASAGTVNAFARGEEPSAAEIAQDLKQQAEFIAVKSVELFHAKGEKAAFLKHAVTAVTRDKQGRPCKVTMTMKAEFYEGTKRYVADMELKMDLENKKLLDFKYSDNHLIKANDDQMKKLKKGIDELLFGE